MAHVTFDIQWRESMMELLDQLEAEHPDEAALAPMEISEYSCIYIKYVQIFRKLEEAYDQMAHPQKRMDMKKAVEAVLGRILEIKSWLVRLNKAIDSVNFDDILVDLKLTPDVLELPIPKYFVEDRRTELEGRAKFLEALVEKYNVGMAWEEELHVPPNLGEEEAIRVLQVNERGRQGRERARLMRALKKTQALEEKMALMGGSVSPEEAATRVQALVRGFLTRRRIHAITEAELVFIGMKPPARDDAVDPVLRELRNLERRKTVQAENIAEYDKALVTLKKKVKETEGQDMRELIQDRINEWFVENRDPATGEYPDFPDAEDGGSKEILNPPPPPPEVDEAAGAPAAKGGKEEKGAPAKGAAGDGEEPKCPDYFVKLIHGAVSDYQGDWQDIDESSNFFQKFDPDLVKKALKPVVFEEIRVEVDEEMRVLLENLKDMVAAERAAKSGKKGKKGKGKKGKGKKGKGKKGKDKKGKKGKKDPTADRSLESLYAELVSNKVIQAIPDRRIDDYVGDFNYLGATLEKAGIVPDASMAQVRQACTEFGILPIGASEHVHTNIPTHTKSILLYGCPKTGKTTLAHAIANAAGANFFNLSPRNIDGKYPGSQVKMLIHMVFKVARVMQPSVIYIDEVEKVFLSDKKKLKEYGTAEPLNRIKKEFLKEVKSMAKGERVLIVGASSEPFLCVKKDQKGLMEFFQKHVHCPLPDYASLRKLWPALVKRHGGGDLTHEFELSTLAHISEGYAPGVISLILRTLLTKRRLEKLPRFPLTCREVLNVMAKFDKVDLETEDAMRDWTCKLPVRVALDPEAAAAADAKGKKKK
mmetsp:Transcript_27563/g.67781  ORF Transcript_27563/g.67781 Transcript_27563/m.67781 type:complete len:819 (-) Transcript_27563:1438-3894(-)